MHYALGTLRAEDAEAFERHLAEGCLECRDALHEFAPEPSPGVLQRLMGRVRADALYTKRSDEGEWKPIGIPGIESRVLFFDRQRNFVTTLLRLAPGAVYPRHRHTEAEECYVLEGDVQVGSLTFRAGDYQRAEAGSIHEIQSTRHGCTLLIMASRNDEIL
jgi:quercetin dioxygenase-like cupin family protein